MSKIKVSELFYSIQGECNCDGLNEVVSDRYTLRKYLQELDNLLHYEGRRTPKNWRGKTSREIGFEVIKQK